MLKRYDSREALLAERGAEGSLAEADLTCLDLSGLDLSGLDLSGANLSGSSLRGAILDHCNLQSIFVQEGDWRETSLRHARGDFAFFQRVAFDGARLPGVELRDTSLLICALNQVDLSGARLEKAQILDSELCGADLTGALLVEANLNGCSLAGTRFIRSDLRGADLRKCNLTQARFEEVLAEGALYYGKSPWDGTSRAEDWAARLPLFDGE